MRREISDFYPPAFRHRHIYIRGEAAAFIPHLSKAFSPNLWVSTPHGLTLNPFCTHTK